ncbi:M23 family metallopeptidase [Methylobacterium pseudosasicola]|uniref:M23 family metallopeptidase n=1 Tax=Methylobacterium pseudosasicola TaxID=582667 RepID=UPI001FCCF52C|nr:M23 family metallopeptidase [Methylobacterium pseudosasicola]
MLALWPIRAGAEPLRLQLPIACEPGRTCFVQYYVDRDPGSGARDFAGGRQTYDKHDGTDFRLPTSVDAAGPLGLVRAAAAGTVLRIRNDAPDVSVHETGMTKVAGVECGNGLVIGHMDFYETQYCHLAEGTVAVRPGERVAAGQAIGHTGLSGATEFPHLHFTVRRAGLTVDPFAPDDSAGGGRHGSLWDDAVGASLGYRSATILNAGFSDSPVTMAAVEAAAARPLDARAETLVAWIRAISLEAGDVQRLVIRAPDGQIFAETQLPPLVNPRAQSLVFTGRRRPAKGFPAGTYEATFEVLRENTLVVAHRFVATLP